MFREYNALNHPVNKNRTNLTGNRIGHNDWKGYHKFTGSCTVSTRRLVVHLRCRTGPFWFSFLRCLWRSAMPARNWKSEMARSTATNLYRVPSTFLGVWSINRCICRYTAGACPVTNSALPMPGGVSCGSHHVSSNIWQINRAESDR